jgi:uncharacterized membrane protein YfcA
MTTLVVGTALVLASFLMGLTGFGFAIVAISLMSFVWPVKQIVPFLFAYNLAINVVLLIQLRAHVRVRRVWPQIVGFIPGALLGLFALYHLSDTALKIAIGATLTVFALWSLGRRGIAPAGLHWAWSVTAGGVSGVLGGAVYMTGPPIIMLNALTHADRFAFKADLQTFFLLSNLYLLIAYGSLGLFSWPLLKLNIYFAPLMLAGLAAGSMTCHRISDRRFQGVSYCMLLLMGSLLVVRAVARIV